MDHIQVPQVWMRNFKHKTTEGYKVYCLSCIDGSITPQKIKELGAEKDYYISDFEHYLDSNWESKFGILNKKILKGIRGDSDRFDINEDECCFIKKFLTLSVGRSKFFKFNLAHKCTNKYPFWGLREIAPLSTMDATPIFNNCNIQFLYNTTDVGFVLPSYTYYYVPQSFRNTGIMVLSDKIAIRFVQKEHSEEFNDIVNCSVININDEENIKNYNYCAMVTEIATNNDFIISKNSKELYMLKNGD
ncbi:MAG: hypothetical protein IJC99_02535 [Clostridia bacterium]|nr:hypothetical protein [Clostridia bacterium]